MKNLNLVYGIKLRIKIKYAIDCIFYFTFINTGWGVLFLIVCLCKNMPSLINPKYINAIHRNFESCSYRTIDK